MYITLACTCGAIIQTTTGFGFGIFVMTLFPIFMPSYAISGAVSSCLALTMNIFNAIRLRKDAHFKLMIAPLIAQAISVYICVCFSLTQTDSNLKRCLGVFLVLISIYFVFIAKNLTIKPTTLNGFIAGAISGAISGMFGAGGGPPIVIYFMATTPSMTAYLATTQTYFAFSGMNSFLARLSKAIITKDVLAFWVVGLAALALGMNIGKKTRGKINDELLKKIVYLYIAFSGVVMIFTA